MSKNSNQTEKVVQNSINFFDIKSQVKARMAAEYSDQRIRQDLRQKQDELKTQIQNVDKDAWSKAKEQISANKERIDVVKKELIPIKANKKQLDDANKELKKLKKNLDNNIKNLAKENIADKKKQKLDKEKIELKKQIANLESKIPHIAYDKEKFDSLNKEQTSLNNINKAIEKDFYKVNDQDPEAIKTLKSNLDAAIKNSRNKEYINNIIEQEYIKSLNSAKIFLSNIEQNGLAIEGSDLDIEALDEKETSEDLDKEIANVDINQEQLLQQFKELDQEYGYFGKQQEDYKIKESAEFKEFAKVSVAMLLRAQFVEQNNNDNAVFVQSYNAMVFFGKNGPEQKEYSTLENVNNYVNNNKKLQTNAHIMHDLFITPLPNAQHVQDLDGWRALINSSVNDNSIIDEFENLESFKVKTPPKDLKEFKERVKKNVIHYRDEKKNPEFAKICRKYKIPESTFKAAIRLLNEGVIGKDEELAKKGIISAKKTEENIPDVTVSSSDIEGVNKTGYHLVKLPAGDMRAAILGRIMGYNSVGECCQSIDGHSKKCVIDGMTLPNSGFYVLLEAKDKKFDVNKIDWKNLEKNAKIVGQSYGWISRSGNLVLDSWEGGTNPEYKDILPQMLEEFGEKIQEQQTEKKVPELERINMVKVGTGGKTSYALGNSPDSEMDEKTQKGYFQYMDSSKQKTVYVSDALTEAKQKLKAKTGQDQIPVVNLAISSKLNTLEDEHLSILANSPHYNELLIRSNIDWACNPDNKDKINNLDSKLFSENALECYYSGQVNIGDLEKLEKSKIDKLISEKAQISYEANFAFETLKNAIEDDAKFNAITSFVCCEANKIKYNDAKREKKSLPKFNNSLSANAIRQDALKTVLCDMETDRNQHKEINNQVDSIQDTDKLNSISLESAYELYKTRVVPLKELSEFYDEELKTQIELFAKEGYKDLVNAAVNHTIAKLSEYNVTVALRKGAKLEELQKLYHKDKDQFKSLTSDSCKNYYELGADFNWAKGQYEKLGREVFEKKIKILASEKLRECYAASERNKFYPSFEQLKEIDDIDRIKILSSRGAQLCYELENGPSFLDLKDLDYKKITALTSRDAQSCYKLETGPSFDDLKDLSVYKISALAEDNAQSCYKLETGPSFDDLKDLSEDKIRILTLRSVRLCYELENGPNFEDLKDLSIYKITVLASYAAKGCYKIENGPNFNDLKDLSADKIKILASEKLRECYAASERNKFYPSFEQLKEIDDIDRIKILSSSDVQECYESEGRPSFDDLKDFGGLKITLLTNNSARSCYELENGPSFDDLKDLPEDEIIALAGSNALECYKLEKGPDFDDLKDLSIDKIKALTSWDASKCYESYRCPSFDQLKEIDDVDKIKTLVSLKSCYESAGRPNFEDLKKIDSLEKIRCLTSVLALKCYESGHGPSFKDLKELDLDEIQALTSENCQNVYADGASFKWAQENLNKIGRKTFIRKLRYLNEFKKHEMYGQKKGFNLNDIKEYDTATPNESLLANDDIKKCYKMGANFKKMKQQYDKIGDKKFNKKVKFLASDLCKECYKLGAKFNWIDIKYDQVGQKKLKSRFEALTSRESRECYGLGLKFKFLADEVKSLGVDEFNKKIKILISKEAKKCYEIENGPSFNDVKDFDANKIKDLTTEDAYKVYRSGKNWKEYATEVGIDISEKEPIADLSLNNKEQDMIKEVAEVLKQVSSKDSKDDPNKGDKKSWQDKHAERESNATKTSPKRS